jgi:hypothetical protein
MKILFITVVVRARFPVASSWRFTAEARIQSQDDSCGICDGKCGTGKGTCTNTSGILNKIILHCFTLPHLWPQKGTVDQLEAVLPRSHSITPLRRNNIQSN